MTAHKLTLRIPEDLFRQIKERAAQRNRSVEDETLGLLASAVPASGALSEDLTAAVAQLAVLEWGDHFQWTPAGDQIIGTTPCGRATVVALNMNRPSLVFARAWVTVGWHPPKD